ncbi:MAG TPA: hypothetical protein VHC95_06295 [Opitutales bacterium]|nr:hypothetical protein [Opitutales bacterium]
MALSQIWTLRRNGDGMEKTLADWGISSARLIRRTQRSDTLEIAFDGAAFDGAELFAYKAGIMLKRNGTAYFAGLATKTPRMARPRAEGVGYTFEGSWWYLEHIVYQQDWKFLNVGGDNLAAVSNLVLAQANDGTLITTGAQIADAVNEAVGAGAALQLGANDCAIQVPPEAGRDLSCAEVIRRMLRWHPDVVTWFDYSTTPPTLKLRQRANLDAAAFSIAGRPHTGMDIAARPDLVPPVVVLKYQTLNEDDGIDQSYINIEQYPGGTSELQPGAVVMTIDLQGTRSQYTKQYLKTAPIEADSLDWWMERLPWLKDANIRNLALVEDSSSSTPVAADGAGGTDAGSGSTDAGVVLANFVVEGEIPEWVAVPGSGHAQMALVEAKLNYDVAMGNDANGNPVVEHRTGEKVVVKLMSTDLGTNWYKQLSAVFVGEPQPVGLAQNYYTALAALQYEGGFEITEEECGATAASFLGRVLNLTGGVAEWSTMRALIFETTEDLATGKTRLRFGPATFLSPKDWLDLNRQNRNRQFGDLNNKVNGLVTLGSTPVGGTGKYDRGGAASKAPPAHDTWVGAAVDGNPGTYKVTIKPAQVDSSAAGQVPSNLTGQWRTIQVCVPDGSGGTTTKSMLVLATEPFTAAGS